MDDLGCNNGCGKVCECSDCDQPPATTTPPTTPPKHSEEPCAICYDCADTEVAYALWGVIIAFIMLNYIHRCLSDRSKPVLVPTYVRMPDTSYTPIPQDSRFPSKASPAIIGYGILSFCCVVVTYYLINFLNVILVQVYPSVFQNMCILVFDWQGVFNDKIGKTFNIELY